jgi:hypothetical protein
MGEKRKSLDEFTEKALHYLIKKKEPYKDLGPDYLDTHLTQKTLKIN